MPYYLVQHNERGNDNIMWLVDGTLSVVPGVTVYAEFLIDDLQFERSTDAPDKYGVTVGGCWYGSTAGHDAELTLEYTNVRKWTYTHKFTEHRFAHDGLPTGFELGPDADRFRGEYVFHPTPQLSLGAVYEHARKGEGRIEVPFDYEEAAEPPFPSGVVESTNRVIIELGYQTLERVAVGLGASYESIENAGNAPGDDDDGWEFWGGVELRI
jgi:hypothetical protein